MKISIVVPVYHEEESIEELLSNIKRLVRTPHETLIIYDSENDPTVNVVKKYLKNKKKEDIKLIKNYSGDKRGVTNAMKSGFESAKGFAVVAVMADLSDDLSDIDKMVIDIKSGADIVCGSRYMRGGKKIGGPILKTFLSKAAGLSLYYFFKLPTHDGTNAYKMYKKSVLNKIKIESTGGFEYSLEITLKAFRAGYKIVELPTVWLDRPAGKSNFKVFKWLPKYIMTYLIIIKKNKFVNSAIIWRNKANKINTQTHLTILFISLLISIIIYIFLVLNLNFNFTMKQTTAINWLSLNHYPKQQDYYFLYSFLSFNFFASLLIWFVWISLKIKK